MKIIAYTALHYGLDYYYYALRSVIDYIDEYYVLYSPVGSHGYPASRPCPETRAQLLSVAQLVAGSKLRWIDGQWAHEGLQRMTIHEVCPDADVIIPIDSDEIWQPGLPELAIAAISNNSIRNWRVPFRHYWRSFYRCILHDPAYPVRVINPHVESGDATMDAQGKAVNHMGYAIRPEMMRYKWEVHGHKNELRHDCDFFTDVYEANRQTDCHPVGSDYWQPETVDPTQFFPEWIKSHPYWGMQVIE